MQKPCTLNRVTHDRAQCVLLVRAKCKSTEWHTKCGTHVCTNFCTVYVQGWSATHVAGVAHLVEQENASFPPMTGRPANTCRHIQYKYMQTNTVQIHADKYMQTNTCRLIRYKYMQTNTIQIQNKDMQAKITQIHTSNPSTNTCNWTCPIYLHSVTVSVYYLPENWKLDSWKTKK